LRTLPLINPCKQRIFTIPKVLKGPPILGIPFLGIFSPYKERVLTIVLSFIKKIFLNKEENQKILPLTFREGI